MVATPVAILPTILLAAVCVPDTNEHHARHLLKIVFFHFCLLIAIMQHLSAQGTGMHPSSLRRGEIKIQVDRISHPATPIRQSPAWASLGMLEKLSQFRAELSKKGALVHSLHTKQNYLIRKRIFRVIGFSRKRGSSCSLGFPREGGSSPHGCMDESQRQVVMIWPPRRVLVHIGGRWNRGGGWRFWL